MIEYNNQQTDPVTSKTSLSALRQAAGILIGIVPIFIPVILMHAGRKTAYSLTELMLYPLCAGTAGLIWILAVYRVVHRRRPRDLNRKPGTAAGDMAAGMVLWLAFNAIFLLSRATLYRWLPSNPSSFGGLIEGLRESPWLLMLWLGPIVWIGVAAFEEVSRAFLLDRIGAVIPGRFGAGAAILGSSALMSLAHLYQGQAGMASVGLMALLSAVYYWKAGRIWPLIMAHAFYDSFWIALAVFQVRL